MNLVDLFNRLFDHRAIVNCDRDPYLWRWFVIRTERLGVYVHRFVRSDEDRALHDHPWDFLAVPIWRGYIEHSERKTVCPHCEGAGYMIAWEGTIHTQAVPCCGDGLAREPRARRVWPIIGTRIHRAEYRHRVELVGGKPAWSLFIRFRKRREWGFWDHIVGFIQWNKWWQEKCE